MKKAEETKRVRIYFDAITRPEQEAYMNALLATGGYVYVDAHRERDENSSASSPIYHCWWELKEITRKELRQKMAGKILQPDDRPRTTERRVNCEAEMTTSNGCCALHESANGVLQNLPVSEPLVECTEKKKRTVYGPHFGPRAYDNLDSLPHRVWEKQCKACRNSCKQHFVPRGCFKCFVFEKK
jgi:hypothetical protein